MVTPPYCCLVYWAGDCSSQFEINRELISHAMNPGEHLTRWLPQYRQPK